MSKSSLICLSVSRRCNILRDGLKSAESYGVFSAKEMRILPSSAMLGNRLFSSKVDKTLNVSQMEALTTHCDEWWDVNGAARALHGMNEVRIPFVRDGILNTLPSQQQYASSTSPLQGLRIVDIGCGGGILSESIAALGAKVDGVDASTDMIEVATTHAQQNPSLAGNLTYYNKTIEEHSKANACVYDAVVMSEVIEHIPEKDLFLRYCCSTLKPGGSIFITTFNRTFLAWFLGIVLSENVIHCIPKGTHDYDMFISPEDLTVLLKKYDCKTTILKGLNYYPFKNQWKFVNNLQFHTPTA